MQTSQDHLKLIVYGNFFLGGTQSYGELENRECVSNVLNRFFDNFRELFVDFLIEWSINKRVRRGCCVLINCKCNRWLFD